MISSFPRAAFVFQGSPTFIGERLQKSRESRGLTPRHADDPDKFLKSEAHSAADMSQVFVMAMVL